MTRQHKLELLWPGKDDWEAPEPRILIEKEKYSSDKDGIKDNLLIHGDNLLGLKALERNYNARVKCVYIDPPYNTKSLFSHYDDSFEHSQWLNMMKERLIILHRLLRDDGSIWISIDDGECHYLKVMCDEIFGRKNFVGNVIWQKKNSAYQKSMSIAATHDHVLVYARNINAWRPHLLPRTPQASSKYKNPDDDSRGPWMADNLTVGMSRKQRPNQYYPILDPATGFEYWPKESRVWSYIPESMQRLIEDNRIIFPSKRAQQPRIKRFLHELQQGVLAKSIWLLEDVGSNTEAKREVMQFNSQDIFATPKPERLVERILQLATDPYDIVLDCFAGSGTTGAVAQKMGRHWVMIELNAHCYTHIIPRLQKVISGDDQGGISKSVAWTGGGGFRYLELAPSLLEKNNLGRWVINKKYNPLMLAEAMCLHAGFTFNPKRDPWWMHGYSTERDFIYVTPSTLTRAQLARLSIEVGFNRTLLVYCDAFRGDADEFHNLTIKKIPRTFLNRCEWGKDDYSLKAALEVEARNANNTEEERHLRPSKVVIKGPRAAKGITR